MKKLILPIILMMMFIPFFVNAETCDTDKISISSITVESKSDSVEELDEASASGKNINLNLSMSEVGDNINYKIIVKNDSNDDYELDKNSFNISSDYIGYILEAEDNSNIVKANSSKTMYLKFEYKTEVPEEEFESGTYNDNKTMTVNLSTGDTTNVPDTIKNPNTGVQSYILVLIIILILSGTLYILLKEKKYVNFMVLLICTAIIIPVSVYAICNYEIRVESNIIINKERYIAIKAYGNCSNNPDVHNTRMNKLTWSKYLEENDMFDYSLNYIVRNVHDFNECLKSSGSTFANCLNSFNYSNKIYFVVNEDIECSTFLEFDKENYSTVNSYHDCSYNNKKIRFEYLSDYIFDSRYGYYVIDKNLCNTPLSPPNPQPN